MTLFLDTSALVKRYVHEMGSDLVREEMDRDPAWFASAIALPEATITICHRFPAGAERDTVQRRIADDWLRIAVVPVDSSALERAQEIGCLHRIRTMDAIHLAAADRLPRPVRFLTFDDRQADGARAMGLDLVVVDA